VAGSCSRLASCCAQPRNRIGRRRAPRFARPPARPEGHKFPYAGQGSRIVQSKRARKPIPRPAKVRRLRGRVKRCALGLRPPCG
jgi:hypothetical protein